MELEQWQISLILLITLFIFILIIKKIMDKKREKNLDWLIFENVSGEENNPIRTFWAQNKITGFKTPKFGNEQKLVRFIR